MNTSLFAGGASGELCGAIPFAIGVEKYISKIEKKHTTWINNPTVITSHNFMVVVDLNPDSQFFFKKKIKIYSTRISFSLKYLYLLFIQ